LADSTFKGCLLDLQILHSVVGTAKLIGETEEVFGPPKIDLFLLVCSLNQVDRWADEGLPVYIGLIGVTYCLTDGFLRAAVLQLARVEKFIAVIEADVLAPKPDFTGRRLAGQATIFCVLQAEVFV